jgi:hypothetical protein
MRCSPVNEREPAGAAGGLLRFRGWLAAVAVSSVALLGGAGALAQVRVEGRPDAVHIDARDASLHEVLEALQTRFNLRYHADDALDSRMTGTFNGPLPRVTARILDGYDFAIKITPQDLDVLILRQHGPSVAPAPAVAKPKAPPAPIMTAAQANRYERERFR